MCVYVCVHVCVCMCVCVCVCVCVCTDVCAHAHFSLARVKWGRPPVTSHMDHHVAMEKCKDPCGWAVEYWEVLECRVCGYMEGGAGKVWIL